MGFMSTSLPPLDTIKHLLERLKANDVAWFRERYKAGDLAWLKDRLPAGGYEKLGERIEAGDLGWLRERIATLPGMNIPGLDLGSFGLGSVGNVGGAATGVATGALKGAASVGGAGVGAAAAAVGGRKRGLWFIPILLLAAIVAALLMKQCNKDDDGAVDSEVASSEAEATEADAGATEAPATEAMSSEAMASMAETTVAAAAATEAGAPAAGGDIVATAQAAGNFSTLTAAIGAAGLTETLQGPGPFTVFAPTDEAFAKLPPGAVDALLKPENKPVLEQILKYHVVGAKVPAADVKTGPAKSVEGSDLDLVSADGKVTVNGANVTTADVASSNGLIHVIDAVLIPKSVDVAALLGGAAAPATEAAAPVTEAAAPVTEAAAAPVNAAGDAVSEDLTVYFANASAAINAEGKAKIEKAVVTLAALPAGTKVNVVGHASAVGNPAANQKLSEARAKNVIAALKAGLGDKASNIEFAASAEGDKNPVENADKSRRVTVEIQK
jgi:uncharacterized surface protein with fasciclin (FAS1) repeats